MIARPVYTPKLTGKSFLFKTASGKKLRFFGLLTLRSGNLRFKAAFSRRQVAG